MLANQQGAELRMTLAVESEYDRPTRLNERGDWCLRLLAGLEYQYSIPMRPYSPRLT